MQCGNIEIEINTSNAIRKRVTGTWDTEEQTNERKDETEVFACRWNSLLPKYDCKRYEILSKEER